MPLTDVAVRNAKPKQKPYKLSDERGLFLLVSTSGAKCWRLKYRILGKEKKLSIGLYPELSLSVARQKRDEARQLISEGIDPAILKQVTKRSKLAAAKNTFELIAREWYVKNLSSWNENHSDRILRRLENNIFPWIGNRPITEITPPELLGVLQKIEDRKAYETAHRARSNCGKIFQYAIASGLAEKNPAKELKDALRPVITKHFASITDLKGIGDLIRDINNYKGHFVTQCALRILPYVFVRHGEIRKAEWTEFELESSSPQWRIMAGRMKKRILHIVPLSKQVVVILNELKVLTGEGRFLFPGINTTDRPLSDNTLLTALRRLGYTGEEMTVHGFRSMASTVLHEQGWPSDAIERQLAHIQGNKVKAAYNYAEHLPIRRKMMQAWADYLDKLATGNINLNEFNQSIL